MQISIKYVFSYLLFKYYTDAVRPLFVTEKFRFVCLKLVISPVVVMNIISLDFLF